MQMRVAALEDALPIVRLRDEAAAWQKSRSIEQWDPGEVAVATIEQQIAAGDWWVNGAGAKLSSAVRVVDSDPAVWSDAVNAGYIHGLVVSRDNSARGVGAQTLSWAEGLIAERGHTLARLDCVLTNYRLRRYYRDQGYMERGETHFPPSIGWRPVMRFEKSVVT